MRDRYEEMADKIEVDEDGYYYRHSVVNAMRESAAQALEEASTYNVCPYCHIHYDMTRRAEKIRKGEVAALRSGGK